MGQVEDEDFQASSSDGGSATSDSDEDSDADGEAGGEADVKMKEPKSDDGPSKKKARKD